MCIRDRRHTEDYPAKQSHRAQPRDHVPPFELVPFGRQSQRFHHRGPVSYTHLRRELAEREIKVEKSDFNIDNMLTTMRQYYRGGRYDFLLNSTENIDLLGKRFIVFEIDSIKENRELFPVVTIIIMEAFINKMRRLKGVRKQLRLGKYIGVGRICPSPNSSTRSPKQTFV